MTIIFSRPRKNNGLPRNTNETNNYHSTSSILEILFHLPCSKKPKYCQEAYTSNKYSGKDHNDIPAGEPQLEQQIAK